MSCIEFRFRPTECDVAHLVKWVSWTLGVKHAWTQYGLTSMNMPLMILLMLVIICALPSIFIYRITDLEHFKRRLHLSTVHKEMSVNLLHAKIPFLGLKRNIVSI